MTDYEGVKPAAPVVVAEATRARKADFDRIRAEAIAEATRLDDAGEFTTEASDRLLQQVEDKIEAVCFAWARSLPPETAVYLDDYCKAYQE